MADAQQQPPNVLLFIVDDMPFLASFTESQPPGVDLQGQTITYPDYPTPNIDAFRAGLQSMPRSYISDKEL